MPDPSVSYRQNERIVVTDADLAQWHTENGAGLTASGPCPVCGHDTSAEIHLDVVAAAAAAAAVPALPPEDRTTRRIACACTSSHAGRPDAVTGGCGRWWLVTLTRYNATWLVHAGGDEGLLPALDALDAATSDELASVRATAGRWLPGITALYGLFGLAGLVVGNSSVQDLPLVGKIVVAVAIVIGLASTIMAVLSGYRAAYGWTTVKSVSNDEDLAVWYRQRRNAALTAPAQLRRAISFSVAAVALLLAGIAALWFWPAAIATPPTAMVTYRAAGSDATQFVCGAVIHIGGNGTEVQLASGSASRSLVITNAQIKTITWVTSCPGT